MRLPGRQDELARRCAEAAAAAKKPLVVVLNVGSPKELPWLDQVPAVLLSYFGGEATAAAIKACLLGEVSPSGRLPTTWPKCLEDVPSVRAHVAAQAAATTEGSGVGDVVYAEGLGLGYRGPCGPAPLFPFGYGLTFTNFAYSQFEVVVLSPPGKALGTARARAQLVVLNAGVKPGSEVVQLYTATEKVPKALRAFARTAELQPGEEATVTLLLDERALGSYFDERQGTWVPPKAGMTVVVDVGSSSQEIQASVTLTF